MEGSASQILVFATPTFKIPLKNHLWKCRDDVVDLKDKQLPAEIELLNGQKVAGTYQGGIGVKTVQSNFGMITKYTPIAFGQGNFQTSLETFRYDGFFVSGMFHDMTGNASLIYKRNGMNFKYIGHFKYGYLDGISRIERLKSGSAEEHYVYFRGVFSQNKVYSGQVFDEHGNGIVSIQERAVFPNDEADQHQLQEEMKTLFVNLALPENGSRPENDLDGHSRPKGKRWARRWCCGASQVPSGMKDANGIPPPPPPPVVENQPKDEYYSFLDSSSDESSKPPTPTRKAKKSDEWPSSFDESDIDNISLEDSSSDESEESDEFQPIREEDLNRSEHSAFGAEEEKGSEREDPDVPDPDMPDPSTFGFSEDELKQIVCLIDEGKEQVQQQENLGEVLFIMGNTGCGKSTAINFMSGCVMERVPASDGSLDDVIVVSEKSPYPSVTKIGHEASSETILPRLLFPACEFAICDTPGFLENRGSVINIPNAVNTVTFTRAPTSLKFLFLLAYDDLRDTRDDKFRRALTVLSSFFGGIDVMNGNKDAILVGITKMPFSFNWDAKDELIRVKHALVAKAGKKGWSLEEDHILFIDPLENSKENKREILEKVIQSVEALCCGQVQFKVTLSAEDQIFLDKISQYFFEMIEYYTKREAFDKLLQSYSKLDSLSCIGHEEIHSKITAFREKIKDKVAQIQSEILVNAKEDILKKSPPKKMMKKLERLCVLDACFGREKVWIKKTFEDTKDEVLRVEKDMQTKRNDEINNSFHRLEEKLKKELKTMLRDESNELASMKNLNSPEWLQKCQHMAKLGALSKIAELCDKIEKEEHARSSLDIFYGGNLCPLQDLKSRVLTSFQQLLVQFQKKAISSCLTSGFEEVLNILRAEKQQILDTEFNDLPETDQAYEKIKNKQLIPPEKYNKIKKVLDDLYSHNDEEAERCQEIFENFHQQMKDDLGRMFRKKMIDQILLDIREKCTQKQYLDISLGTLLCRLKDLEKDSEAKSYPTILHELSVSLNHYQDPNDIATILDAENFNDLAVRYSALQTLQQELKNHMQIDLGPFEQTINSYLAELNKKALVEIKSKAGGSNFLKFDELKKYFRFVQSMKSNGVLKKDQEMRLAQEMNVRCREAWESSQKYLMSLDIDTKDEQYDEAVRYILKHYTVSLEMSIQNEFQAFVHNTLLSIDPAVVDTVGRQMLGMVDDPDVGQASQAVLDKFPEFKRYMFLRFNEKARGVDFNCALTKIQQESSKRQLPFDGENRQLLESVYNVYFSTYQSHIQNLIFQKENYDSRALVSTVRSLAQELSGTGSSKCLNTKSSSDLHKYPDKVGSLLAGIFAYWTYLQSSAQFLSGDKDTLLQPHATQVLSILRLIGIDQKSEVQNHVAEIKTGEGKSVALGILSSFYALLGFTVKVVCYSPYLCHRDGKSFSDLRLGLEIDNKIEYCTINTLCDSVQREFLPDVRNEVKTFLKGQNVPLNKRHSAKIRSGLPSVTKANQHVLLIDEVDVFFGKDFYGQCMNMCVIVKSPGIKQLYEYVWQQRESSSLSATTVISQPFMQSILEEFPKLDSIIKKIIYEILDAVKDFPVDRVPKHEYKVGRNGRKIDIGYIDAREGAMCYRTFFGSRTIFACFYERDKGKIEESILDSKCGLSINCGSILYSELPKFFDFILAVTGTLEGLSDEENSILQAYRFVRTSFIPSTFTKKALAIEPTFLARGGRNTEYFDAIKAGILEKVAASRACLVVFESRRLLQNFAQQLRQKPINHPRYQFPEILHEQLTNQERDAVIMRAVSQHKVTLITRSFGRGTDFVCRDSALPRNDGMHVILTFYPEMKTEEIQIKGRTCRQDDPGSFRMVLLADDLGKKKLVKQKLANSTFVADLQEFDQSGQEIDEYLCLKRKELDSKRYNEMEEDLKRNRAKHELTMEMVSYIQANNNRQAVEILTKFNSCAAECASQDHQTTGKVSLCLGNIRHNPFTQQNLPQELRSIPGTLSTDGHFFHCQHSGGASVHIIFVVDRSGSMWNSDSTPSRSTLQQNALGCVYEACLGFVSKRLQVPNALDSMSMVAFDDSANIVFENVPVGAGPIEDANREIRPSGGTNYSPALDRTFEILERAESGSGTGLKPMVMFLSDGDASDCCSQLNSKLEARHRKGKKGGVRFHTISFGSKKNAVLEKMAKTAKDFLHNDEFASESSFLSSINGVDLAQAFVAIAHSLGTTNVRVLA